VDVLRSRHREEHRVSHVLGPQHRGTRWEAGATLRRERVPDGGIGSPGGDERQSHTGAVELRRKRLVQPAEPVLARGIGGVLGEAGVVGDAADAHEGAATGGSHGGKKGAREKERRPQIDGELGVEIRRRSLVQGPEQKAARAVHHHRRRSLLAEHPLGEALHLGGIGQVTGKIHPGSTAGVGERP
jgi:hypothetical protein